MIIYISTIGRYVRAFEFGQCIPSTSTCILLPQLSSGFGETLPVAFASWDTSPTLPAGCKFQLSLSRLCGVLCSDARRAAYALEKLRTLLLCYSQYASDFRHLQTYLRDTLRGCWACSRLLRIDLLWFAESDWICSILFNSVQVSKSFRFSDCSPLTSRRKLENWLVKSCDCATQVTQDEVKVKLLEVSILHVLHANSVSYSVSFHCFQPLCQLGWWQRGTG